MCRSRLTISVFAGFAMAVAASSVIAAPAIYSVGSSGDYDEQTNNLNGVDVEASGNSSTLAAFRTSLTAAFANNTGGVVDFTKIYGSTGTLVASSKSGTETGELYSGGGVPLKVIKGTDANTVLMTLNVPSGLHSLGANPKDAAMVYVRKFDDSSTGLPAISGTSPTLDKYYADSLITSNRYATGNAVGYLYFDFLSPISEVGITALPAQWHTLAGRSSGVDYTQQVTATFSGGGTRTLSSTMSKNGSATALGSNSDTFFHIAAPTGESITKLELLDPARGGMIAFDDLAFISAAAVPEPSTWVLCAAGGLAAVAVAVRRRR